MARTRRNSTVAKDTTTKTNVWYYGRYLRLSKEKLGEKIVESESIDNQRQAIVNHTTWLEETQGDKYVLVDDYVDDGISGSTDEERDDFMRLLGDIEAGKVNCVIVKDLSRSFRNQGDLNTYLTDWFPRRNVRFISLLCQPVDSYLDPESIENMGVSVQGMVDESHVRDTSRKVRFAFDLKRKNGQFINGFPPYGYIADPEIKGAFIVDPVAAENVKFIFNAFLQGKSKRGLATELNDSGVLCPTLYKREVLKMNYRNPHSDAIDRPMWSEKTISAMLKNQTYCGDMVQGRQRIKSYKLHIQEEVPRDEWYIVENTHEAIIDRETFNRVQDLLKRDTRTAPGKNNVYLFSGFLRCADCGRAMTRSVGRGVARFYCGTYKNNSKNACTKHMLREDDLEAAVLYAVQQQVHLAVEYTEAVAAVNRSPVKNNQSKRLTDTLAQKEASLTRAMKYSRSLYQDYKDGEITKRQYQQMNLEYEAEIETLEKMIEVLQSEIDELSDGFDEETECLRAYRKYQNITKLTREIITTLVDRITVYEGGNVSIRFKFGQQMSQVQEYIELNNPEIAV